MEFGTGGGGEGGGKGFAAHDLRKYFFVPPPDLSISKIVYWVWDKRGSVSRKHV